MISKRHRIPEGTVHVNRVIIAQSVFFQSIEFAAHSKPESKKQKPELSNNFMGYAA
jgi:alpha-D-ribose 1-methylphosphonate 5-phosphate C-P lyase